jgi:GPI ethanolamine phosphate transferase 1
MIGAIWPAFYGVRFFKENKWLVLSWSAGCLILSTFTLLPVVKIENTNTVSAGGLLMAGTGILYILFEQSITSQSRTHRGGTASLDTVSRSIMGIQVGLILLAILVTRGSISSLQAKKGLQFGNQIIGWFILIASLTLPFVHKFRPNNHYLHRLIVIFLTFSPSFIILTISYEGLFYLAFCATLITWVRLEHRIYTSTNQRNFPTNTSPSPTTTNVLVTKSLSQYRPLTLSDTRIALIFFFLLQSAFFSTGNIASVSSFSLDAVYRLIPIFDPFSQGALLLFKLMVPFAVISANLGILNLRLGLEPSALFMVVMAISDVMTLNFFWMVRDEGSWLDIGTSISHFFIGSLLNIFVAGLEGVSGWFIEGVEVDNVVVEDENQKHGNGMDAVEEEGVEGAEDKADVVEKGVNGRVRTKGEQNGMLTVAPAAGVAAANRRPS